MEQDVEADDEAKPPGKRSLKRHKLRLRWRVKGRFKVRVEFMVACHQLTAGTAWRNMLWTLHWRRTTSMLHYTWKPHWCWTASVHRGDRRRWCRAAGRPCWPLCRGCNDVLCSSTCGEPIKQPRCKCMFFMWLVLVMCHNTPPHNSSKRATVYLCVVIFAWLGARVPGVLLGVRYRF